MKTISVIVPVYNYARYLGEAIESAFAQTYPALEVIVVDDGSTDDTPDVLAAYGNRLHAIRQQNQGVSAARNTGIAAARGDYIAFLDADDLWKPEKLEAQMARFEADPSLGLVYCGAESFNAKGQTTQVWRDGMQGRVAIHMLRFDHGAMAAPGCNIVVPKRVAEEIGGFDARMTVSEDWDFYYRVAARYAIGFVPDALVRYRIHGSGAHRNVAQMEKGMLLALQKAFASADSEVQSVRNLSYGRLHRMLAGSYFEMRQPVRFAEHVFRSLRYDARNLGYFAAYPLRALARLS